MMLVLCPVLSLSLLLVLSCPGSGLEFRYHNTEEVENFLREVNRSNPDITHLHSIGQSEGGRELWVMVLGRNPKEHTVGVPEFKYVGNMHGNEVVGRVLLLQLIDHLVRGYHSNDPSLSRLLKSTRVHILVSMNPDGFEVSEARCLYGVGRFNKNGVDLNRNFPDAFSRLRQQQQSVEERREMEVRAVMDWLETESFVLSANLHGGALVASYPYDNRYGGSELVGGASVAPDNDVFVHLAKVYSHSHASMYHGDRCHDNRKFTDGITNGYQWYPLTGGMQDYNYVWARCLEITLELSCCKYPPANQLPSLWTDNRAALLAYIQQVHLGVKGRVLDGSGVPVQNALVEVSGRNNLYPFRTDRHGEYYRLLLPGNYTFTVTFPGHKVLTETLNVPHGPDAYSALTHDFLLQRATVTTSSAPNPHSHSAPNPHSHSAPTIAPPWGSLALGLGLRLVTILL